ncbi:hypothetical protein MKW92_036216, partial [Papaver armeniacum]
VQMGDLWKSNYCPDNNRCRLPRVFPYTRCYSSEVGYTGLNTGERVIANIDRCSTK